MVPVEVEVAQLARVGTKVALDTARAALQGARATLDKTKASLKEPEVTGDPSKVAPDTPHVARDRQRVERDSAGVTLDTGAVARDTAHVTRDRRSVARDSAGVTLDRSKVARDTPQVTLDRQRVERDSAGVARDLGAVARDTLRAALADEVLGVDDEAGALDVALLAPRLDSAVREERLHDAQFPVDTRDVRSDTRDLPMPPSDELQFSHLFVLALSQSEVPRVEIADACGVLVRTVRRWEAGQCEPAADVKRAAIMRLYESGRLAPGLLEALSANIGHLPWQLGFAPPPRPEFVATRAMHKVLQGAVREMAEELGIDPKTLRPALHRLLLTLEESEIPVHGAAKMVIAKGDEAGGAR